MNDQSATQVRSPELSHVAFLLLATVRFLSGEASSRNSPWCRHPFSRDVQPTEGVAGS